MSWRVIEGDCIEAMAAMDEASVDAIVTDPPYGLEFMGKEWDRLGAVPDRGPGPRGRNAFGGWHGSAGSASGVQAWHHRWAVEALRVLKPGGHLVSFGGTRTYHRLTCGLEDAGFEIRDCLAWLFGSGFPKSLDVSKAIDKANGAEREVVGVNPNGGRTGTSMFGQVVTDGTDMVWTVPATPDAERWKGWGTALKPAFEPIVLARKPLAGTVAANVLAHGTGALNVDGCRIELAELAEGETGADVYNGPTGPGFSMDGTRAIPAIEVTGNDLGRWPANVLLDENAADLLDEQTGEVGAAAPVKGTEPMAPAFSGNLYGAPAKGSDAHPFYADRGGASRFMYVAKADRAEREHGLQHRTRKALLWSSGEQSPGTFQADGTNREVANHHPTVKPIALMTWLVRLITPPGGLVLDPFMGSGSTGIAALREGFDFIGVEREPEYVAIARDRIIGDAPLLNVGAEA